MAVIMVNWNAWRDTVECLDTVLALDYPVASIWIVDNQSSDESVENISQWCKQPTRDPRWRDVVGVRRITDLPATMSRPVPCRVVNRRGEVEIAGPEECRITLVRAGGNLGFAGGNNLGIELSTPEHVEYFWLLNTDTIVDAWSLRKLVEHALSDDSYGMVGSTLLYYNEPNKIQAMGGGTLNRKNTSVRHIGEGEFASAATVRATAVEAEMNYVVGASMLVSARLVKQVGMMQEDYFLYFEEVDWAMRSASRFRLGYAPASLVYHKVGQSSAKVASMFSLQLLYANRIRFAARFFPDRVFATLRHLTLEMIRHLIKGRRRQAVILAKVLAGSREIVRSTKKG